ncbi:MAG: HK97 gp10 family phage protein [Candidatus Brocadiales bacterium]|nr:HK97 gp10 family phage protein [Candidatus Brocadiales bacterium]
MIDVDIDFKALEKASWVVSGVSELVLKELEAGMMNLATVIGGHAKEKLKEHGAIDQGQLWNSITIVPISKTEVIVGTNVSYAAAVEFGTKGHWLHIESTPGFRGWLTRHGIDKNNKMEFFYVEPKPRPYMEPAFAHAKSMVPSVIETRVKNVLSRLKNL